MFRIFGHFRLSAFVIGSWLVRWGLIGSKRNRQGWRWRGGSGLVEAFVLDCFGLRLKWGVFVDGVS